MRVRKSIIIAEEGGPPSVKLARGKWGFITSVVRQLKDWWGGQLNITSVNLVMKGQTDFGGGYIEKELGFRNWNMCCNRMDFRNLTLTSGTATALWVSSRECLNESFQTNRRYIIIVNFHMECICGPSTGRFRPLGSVRCRSNYTLSLSFCQ